MPKKLPSGSRMVANVTIKTVSKVTKPKEYSSKNIRFTIKAVKCKLMIIWGSNIGFVLNINKIE